MGWVHISVWMLHRGYRLFAVVALCLALTNVAAADARTDFLVKMLTSSTQFRVRTQAALALGAQPPAPDITQALTKALSDEHPAVRAASASALERIKDASTLTALRAAQNDSDASVRAAVKSAIDAMAPKSSPAVAAASGASSSSSSSGTSKPVGTVGNATYYVGVGVPGSQVGLSAPALRALREHVVRQVTQIEGVVVAPENEDNRAAQKVIGASKLVGYFVDSSVTNIEARPDGSVRAQVSVIIGTYPGRDMRAMLSGAATVSGGGGGEAAKVQAVEAAFVGALRRLPQAMQAGLARAQ